MAGSEGLAGMRLVPARKLHVYETLDLHSVVLRLSWLETRDSMFLYVFILLCVCAFQA